MSTTDPRTTSFTSNSSTVTKVFSDKEFSKREPLRALLYSCRECDLPSYANTNFAFLCSDTRKMYIGQGDNNALKEITPSNAQIFTESGEINLSVFYKKSETMNTSEIQNAINNAITAQSLPVSTDIVTKNDLIVAMDSKASKNDVVKISDMEDSIKYHIARTLESSNQVATSKALRDLEDAIYTYMGDIRFDRNLSKELNKIAPSLVEAILELKKEIDKANLKITDDFEDQFNIIDGVKCHEFALAHKPIGKIKFYLNGIRFFDDAFDYIASSNTVKWVYTSSNGGLDITTGTVVIEYDYDPNEGA